MENRDKSEMVHTTSTISFGKGMGGGLTGAKGEKAVNLKKAVGNFAVYCKGWLTPIGAAAVFALLGSILNIMGPGQLSHMTNLITDGMTGTMNISLIVCIAGVLVLIYMAGFFCSICQGMIMAKVTQGVSKKMRSDLQNKLSRLPLKYFDSTTIGDTLSRITNDVDSIGQTLNQSLGVLISSGTMFLGTLAIMVWTNWIMALTVVLSTGIGFALMFFLITRSQTYFVNQQKQIGLLNGHIEETFGGHQVVQAYNGEENARKHFFQINQALYKCAWKSQFMSGIMQPIMAFIGNFGYVAVCITGGILVLNGSILFGTVIAFILYVRLFSQPLTQLAQAVSNLQSAAAAGERVFEFLNAEEMEKEITPKVRIERLDGNVEFRNVWFGYNDKNPVIKNFSFKIEEGQKIAIVGPTGAGKTTIVNLLMRFYELQQGGIYLDGVSAKELTRENVRDLFCMVLQETWLFEGTIRENIVYAQPDITDRQVEMVCQQVGLDHFIRTLPNGYDTVLNEISSLSEGQRQLITIARAMIKNAPILILDEATSSVDTRTELLVQKAMDQLMAGRTSFIIAHRLSTIRNADQILVMRDGGIIEHGNHEELIRKNGFYAELYNSQFEE